MKVDERRTNDIRERTRRVVAREKATGADVLPMPSQFLAAWVGVWVARHQANQIEYLKTVNRALMERMGKKRLRFTDAERRKLAVLGKKLSRKALGELATIGTPDTILRWYRELVAKKYDGSARRGPGRPRTATEVVRLLIEMAARNTGWGYTRLRGALKNGGYAVGRNTIKRILKEHGIDPAPLRRRQYSWATFIKAHLSAITAADFFTVEVLNWAGLVRYHVFFVIHLASRRVEIAGISRSPDGPWMEQVARNLLDADDGFLVGRNYLIVDRDPLYTRAFRTAMERGGVDVLRLPPSSPNLNACAERFVLSIRSECLDRIVLLGETHLRRSVTEFVQHYRLERSRQGLENNLIESTPGPANTNGRVERRERLGGLLNFYYYYRRAA
jgi:transposase InsO family protein